MSRKTLPAGFKIKVVGEPDDFTMQSWSFYAFVYEWKTVTRRRFLRWPVIMTGWHVLGKSERLGSWTVDQKKLDAFIQDWIQTIKLRERGTK
jgi:hypothetical protein